MSTNADNAYGPVPADQPLALKSNEGLGAWLPIATAPRDGTYVLVSSPECGGSWVARYAPLAVSGYRFDQPWRSMMLNHHHLRRDAAYGKPPTHWQPLPASPQVSA